MSQYETVKSFLTTLAAQKNLVLSHTPTGNLLLTQADGNKSPIFHFADKGTWVHMSLSFDGQQMHDKINVTGQVNVTNPNSASDSVELNPYLSSTRGSANTSAGGGYSALFRPVVYEQTASTDVSTTPLTARKKLGNELKAIRLKIDIFGWELGGVIPRAGDIVTVTNPDIFLYQKTKWFIESVDFRGNEKEDTATLNCVLPECFNNDKVVNIFTGSNLTVPYSETGAHATITPFI
jgi:prophage tail gpP-like protein